MARLQLYALLFTAAWAPIAAQLGPTGSQVKLDEGTIGTGARQQMPTADSNPRAGLVTTSGEGPPGDAANARGRTPSSMPAAAVHGANRQGPPGSSQGEMLQRDFTTNTTGGPSGSGSPQGGTQGSPGGSGGTQGGPGGPGGSSGPGGTQRRPQINFMRVPSLLLVKPGGRLSFTGVELSQLADVFSYSFKPQQPYINQAVGYVLWPSIALSPNATVSLQDVVASFVNPSILDSCEEYMGRQVIGLQSTLGTGNAAARNATAITVSGPVSVNVIVLAGDSHQTVGEATATFSNVTFVCLPNPMGEPGLPQGPQSSMAQSSGSGSDLGPGTGFGPQQGPGSGSGPPQGPGSRMQSGTLSPQSGGPVAAVQLPQQGQAVQLATGASPTVAPNISSTALQGRRLSSHGLARS